ncbi:protein PAXX isoform X2 [Elgaria multicarinata webbii]|uniref:protein PAXX isoform X2 n=1 Tax=Elgaria multicarinata webbii TaxID=159646 RepID=UPI002FCCEDD6
MALPGALRVVSHEGQRFLCFCDGGSSSSSSSSFPRLYVTNASEFWSCEVTSEKLDGCLSLNESASPDDCNSKLREFLGCQTPVLSVCDSRATLEFQDGRQSVTFDLHKVPLSEARMRLQDLTFGLVAQVHQLEKRLEESATAALPLGSPEKSPFRSQSLFASVRRRRRG